MKENQKKKLAVLPFFILSICAVVYGLIYEKPKEKDPPFYIGKYDASGKLVQYIVNPEEVDTLGGCISFPVTANKNIVVLCKEDNYFIIKEKIKEIHTDSSIISYK